MPRVADAVHPRRDYRAIAVRTVPSALASVPVVIAILLLTRASTLAAVRCVPTPRGATVQIRRIHSLDN